MEEKSVVLATMALVLVAAATPAQSPLEAMRACAAEKDDGARLACYDRAMAAATPQPATPPPATPPPVADEFGVGGQLRRKRNPQEKPPEVAQELRARVASVERRQADKLRVRLDNGQVWIETERKAGFVVNEGDAVTIKPGLFGAFFLTLDSGVALRVKRVQ